MAALSLAMWFSLPTFDRVLEAYGPSIEERRSIIVAIANDLPGDGHAAQRLVRGTLDPLPQRVKKDRKNHYWGGGNTEFFDPDGVREIVGRKVLHEDASLYLRGRLGLLIYWRSHQSPGGRRMARKRRIAEFETPLNAHYVILYGTQASEQVPDGHPAAMRVDAFLYNLKTGSRLAEFAFIERVDPSSPHLKERFLKELATLTGGEFDD
jgi:hypothetical protein